MGRTFAALVAAILACLCWTGAARAQAPTASDFQKVTLDDNTQNPMQLDVAPDGRVFYIERDGRVQIWKPDTQQTVTAGKIPVTLSQENGLLGIALAPDFAFSKWVYLFYSQLPDDTLTQVISRFKVEGDTLDMSSEQKILTFKHQTAQCCHSSGALGFGPDGSLYASAGDNTNPFDSDGFDPIDERAGREYWDAQRTAGNTNDLNGKIIHIMPMEIPTGPPGVNTTYTIPANNLFPEGTPLTRPEIFGMGFRNPFRFTVDPTTGWVLMGDYGPDAGTTNPNRGPQGSVEFNVLTKAGNYGWPYCIRDNVPYNDYNFETKVSGPKFNCDAPVNDSPNNTGLRNLPPAIGASAWMGYTEQDPRFTPDLGGGGAPMGGPRYHFDPTLDSDRKFPAYYDKKWFVGEWNNGWIKTADLNDDGTIKDFQSFALGTGYKRPMDMKFGPDGAM
jgi:glucose/arabinose dehydrogenase